jgi:hypothetical protein
MSKNFLAPEGEVAKSTAGMAGGGGSADLLKGDAFRDQHAARECMKTARKVCVAPMMDWTDEVDLSLYFSGLRSLEDVCHLYGTSFHGPEGIFGSTLTESFDC